MGGLNLEVFKVSYPALSLMFKLSMDLTESP